MSGVLKQAKRIGAINGVNPMQDVSIPKARPGGETYAYSLEEIFRMISVLPEPASTIIATAAFTGLRKSEIRGLLWENFHEEALWVTQSVWERFVNEPKTTESKAPVPVIAPLTKRLEKHREAHRAPTAGFIFCLATLRRQVRPGELELASQMAGKARVQGRGHPTARLARVPARAGHEPSPARRAGQDHSGILRHSNLSTTMNSYVKSVPADASAAMRKLEAICTQYAPQLG